MASDYDPNDPLKGASTCPHCGGYAKISEHPKLRFVCNVCGAPRIKLNGQYQLSGHERQHLNKARAAERGRLWWRVAGILGGIAGGFGLLIVGIIALFGAWTAAGITFGLTLPFLLVLLASVSKSGGQFAEVQQHLAQAWKSAGRDVVTASPDGITAQQLAQVMPIDAQQVENMVAELSVDNMLQSRITNDGRLCLQPIAGVRIDAGATGSAQTLIGDPLEARFDALEEAQAAEDQAAAEAQAAATAKARK